MPLSEASVMTRTRTPDSSHTSSLALAEALIVQPEGDSGRAMGDLVEVIPLQML